MVEQLILSQKVIGSSPVGAAQVADTNKPKKPNKDVLSYIDQNYVYEPETGKILRVRNYIAREVGRIKYKRWGNRLDPYLAISFRLQGKYGPLTDLQAHHVAWYLYKGEWPDQEIDHIDDDTLNNKPDNLRKVTSKENNPHNKKKGRLA